MFVRHDISSKDPKRYFAIAMNIQHVFMHEDIVKLCTRSKQLNSACPTCASGQRAATRTARVFLLGRTSKSPCLGTKKNLLSVQWGQPSFRVSQFAKNVVQDEKQTARGALQVPTCRSMDFTVLVLAVQPGGCGGDKYKKYPALAYLTAVARLVGVSHPPLVQVAGLALSCHPARPHLRLRLGTASRRPTC
ncbi:hypothetical protein BX600DRAFT_527893 [Xylariales sp. PMI_506]|nr:hypothetical protein BX600DRAFT_527893 [Xylariales sp. PMI_506]